LSKLLSPMIRGRLYAISAIVFYTFGILFLSNQREIFQSPSEGALYSINSLKFLPFIFLIIAGILVIFHLKHIRIRKKDKVTKNYNKLVYLVGIAGPLASIPQIIQIWFNQTAAGVSITSWTIYMAFAFVWLGYGVVHKYKPIILTNTLWIIFEAIIILGALLY
jgi:uncharacterized protein with PQ loop repeat